MSSTLQSRILFFFRLGIDGKTRHQNGLIKSMGALLDWFKRKTVLRDGGR